MKKYVVGDYYESPDQIRTIQNDKWRKILDSLENAYPNAMTPLRVWEDLEKDTGMSDSTVYNGINMLRRHHFIHGLKPSQKKEIDENRILFHKDGTYDAEFYIVEQSDSTINLLSRHEDPKKRLPKYILAPGYVEYDEKFSRAWDILLSKVLIKEDTLGELSRDILQLLNTVMSITSENEGTKEVAPSVDYSSIICMNCGINHEARNFLRAVMLKILDYIEISPEYRDFLKEKNIINDSGYEHYKDASEYNDQILKPLLEEKTLERQELKEEHGRNRQKPPPGVIWMRIIVMDIYRFHGTKEINLLAFSHDGLYIHGTILNRLKPKNMREGALIEYTGPIEPYIIHPDELDITPESKETKVPMRILQEDDGSIAGRGTIPLDSISSIKEDRRIYHVFGRILDKEEYFLRKIIRIADNSGEIGYHFQSDTFDKVKVGDRIDVIGRCSLNEYGTASLSSALSGSDVIHLSASDQEI